MILFSRDHDFSTLCFLARGENYQLRTFRKTRLFDTRHETPMHDQHMPVFEERKRTKDFPGGTGFWNPSYPHDSDYLAGVVGLLRGIHLRISSGNYINRGRGMPTKWISLFRFLPPK